MSRYASLAGFLAICTAMVIVAQPPTSPKKKTTATQPEPMQITAKSVSGIAQKRLLNDENSKWEEIKTGDILTEQTIIRTGLTGKIVLKFSDQSETVIKCGTKVTISSFDKNGKPRKTCLDLQSGTISEEPSSPGSKSASRVRRTARAVLMSTNCRHRIDFPHFQTPPPAPPSNHIHLGRSKRQDIRRNTDHKTFIRR